MGRHVWWATKKRLNFGQQKRGCPPCRGDSLFPCNCLSDRIIWCLLSPSLIIAVFNSNPKTPIKGIIRRAYYIHRAGRRWRTRSPFPSSQLTPFKPNNYGTSNFSTRPSPCLFISTYSILSSRLRKLYFEVPSILSSWSLVSSTWLLPLAMRFIGSQRGQDSVGFV